MMTNLNTNLNHAMFGILCGLFLGVLIIGIGTTIRKNNEIETDVDCGGRRSYFNGVSAEANPYQGTRTFQAEKWLDEWIDAHEEFNGLN